MIISREFELARWVLLIWARLGWVGLVHASVVSQQPTGPARWICSMWPLLLRWASLGRFSWWRQCATTGRGQVYHCSGLWWHQACSCPIGQKGQAESGQGREGSKKRAWVREQWNAGALNQPASSYSDILFRRIYIAKTGFQVFMVWETHFFGSPCPRPACPERVLAPVKTGVSLVGPRCSHCMSCSTCSVCSGAAPSEEGEIQTPTHGTELPPWMRCLSCPRPECRSPVGPKAEVCFPIKLIFL